MNMCGFEVSHVSNFQQQGLVEPRDETAHFKYTENAMSEKVKASVQFVQQVAPDSKAIVIVGTRAITLERLCVLEASTKHPVIPADTAMHWQVAQYINLTLSSQMGWFKQLSYQASY